MNDRPVIVPAPMAGASRAPLPSADADGCDDGCNGRRDFLRDAFAAVLAAAGLSALTPIARLEALGTRAGPGRGTVRYPIPAADGVSVDKPNDVMIARAGGMVYAFALACPHQNTALRTLPGTSGFQCPRHKSRYQTDGTFISGRATRNMDRLQISRDGDVIVVDPDVAFESDANPGRWAAAYVKL